MVMYQADPSQSLASDEIMNAVQDTINHNNWTAATFTVRTMNPNENVPAGTQFWVCSGSGQVAFASGGMLRVAEPAVVQDPSLFPPPRPSLPIISTLVFSDIPEPGISYRGSLGELSPC